MNMFGTGAEPEKFGGVGSSLKLVVKVVSIGAGGSGFNTRPVKSDAVSLKFCQRCNISSELFCQARKWPRHSLHASA